jgi:hypothetical protein
MTPLEILTVFGIIGLFVLAIAGVIWFVFWLVFGRHK